MSKRTNNNQTSASRKISRKDDIFSEIFENNRQYNNDNEINQDIYHDVLVNVLNFQRIIKKKMNEFYYKKQIETNLKSCCEKCCNEEQMGFLVKTIESFFEKEKTIDNEIKRKIAVKTIVYYFFQIVILETQYTDLLETSYFLDPLDMENNRIFHRILAGFIFGNEPEYMEVRRKFLNLSKTPFNSRTGGSRSTRKNRKTNSR